MGKHGCCALDCNLSDFLITMALVPCDSVGYGFISLRMCVCISAFCMYIDCGPMLWLITSSHGHTHIIHRAFVVRGQRRITNVIFQRFSDRRDYGEQRGLKIQEGPVYVILINKLPKKTRRLLCAVQSLV